VDRAAFSTQIGPEPVILRTHVKANVHSYGGAGMKDLLDQLKREVRRLRDQVAPTCSDNGINTLMDIHDELLRIIRRIESSLRSEKMRTGNTDQKRQSTASTSQ
jgi:hypothetical protein